MSVAAVPDNLDYRQSTKQSSYYRYHKVKNSDGQSAPVLSLTAPTSMDFEICKQGPENLSRSSIHFVMTLAAGGGTEFHHLWCDRPPIQSIELRNIAGETIDRITNLRDVVRNYVYAFEPIELAKTNVSGLSADTAANARLTGAITCRGSINVDSSTVATSHAHHAAFPLDAGALWAAGTLAKRSSNTARQSHMSSAVGAAMSMEWDIPLSILHGSLFAQDRDIWAESGLTLNIVFAPAVEYGWLSTNAGPVTVDNFVSNAAALATLATISDLYVRVARQADQDAAAAVKSLVRGQGMQFVFPTTAVITKTLGADTNVNPQIKLNASIGTRLLRLGVALKNTTETISARANFVYGKYTKIQTYFDDKPIQFEELDIANGEDWRYIQNYLKGSANGGALGDYRYNTIWIDDFSGLQQAKDADHHDRSEAGILLDQEHTYAVQYTKGASAHSVNFYVTTQRSFYSNSQGAGLAV